MDLCFNRIDKRLRMPESNLHFLAADNLQEYPPPMTRHDAWSCRAGRGR